MKSLTTHVGQFCKQHHLLDSGDTVILALSGGIDSMVMLSIFIELQPKWKLNLEAVHINHKIRLPDTDRDEDFVGDICRRSAIPLHKKELSGFNLQSSEEALREARYAFFDELLANKTGTKIATAHHLNDQIETIIMRLMRGSSVRGLQGIPEKRDNYIRPLLSVSREDINRFAKEQHIEYRVDFTNNSLDKTRNRIRHQIVPTLLDIFGDRLFTDFQHAVQRIKQFNQSFNGLSSSLFESLLVENDMGINIRYQEWQQLDQLLRHKLIEYCVSKLSRLNCSLTENYINAVEKFIIHGLTGSQMKLTGRVMLTRNRDHLQFYLDQEFEFDPHDLRPEEEISFGRNKLSLHQVAAEEIQYSADRNIEFICGDRISSQLQVRTWRRGDFFYPLGLNARQKLSDFFVNQKINRRMKHHIPIVVNRDEIVWIAGYRLDHRYRIQPDCQTIFRLMYKGKQDNG